METIVVKIGGVASENLTPSFFETIADWQAAGKKVVIVHGLHLRNDGENGVDSHDQRRPAGDRSPDA